MHHEVKSDIHGTLHDERVSLIACYGKHLVGIVSVPDITAYLLNGSRLGNETIWCVGRQRFQFESRADTCVIFNSKEHNDYFLGGNATNIAMFSAFSAVKSREKRCMAIMRLSPCMETTTGRFFQTRTRNFLR